MDVWCLGGGAESQPVRVAGAVCPHELQHITSFPVSTSQGRGNELILDIAVYVA